MHVPHAHLMVLDKLSSLVSQELLLSGQARTQKCPCVLMEPMTLARVFCPSLSSSLSSSERLAELCCMLVISERNPQWTPPRRVGNSFCMASSPEEERSPCLYFVRTLCFWSNIVWWVSSTDCNTTENITSSKEFG